VNYSAGANTGVASIFTAAMIAVTVLFLTPLFYYLPNAVLASIIVVAVINLFDFETVRFVGRYSKADFASLALTFLSVLVFGVAQGIVVGAVISLVLYLWRTSTPHIAVVGRVGKSEHYRNVLRHDVETWPEVVLLRVDESLYFANAGTLADVIMGQIADHPQARSVVLIASAVNNIDVTALDMLMHIVEELRSEGVELHLADVKGPVMDKLERIGFVDLIGSDSIHLSVHEALKSLGIISEADATMQPVANGAASEHPESV
jgi:SulP family sulfate permease